MELELARFQKAQNQERMKEEEMRRQEEEMRRQEEEMRRQEAEMRCKEAEMRRNKRKCFVITKQLRKMKDALKQLSLKLHFLRLVIKLVLHHPTSIPIMMLLNLT